MITHGLLTVGRLMERKNLIILVLFFFALSFSMVNAFKGNDNFPLNLVVDDDPADKSQGQAVVEQLSSATELSQSNQAKTTDNAENTVSNDNAVERNNVVNQPEPSPMKTVEEKAAAATLTRRLNQLELIKANLIAEQQAEQRKLASEQLNGTTEQTQTTEESVQPLMVLAPNESELDSPIDLGTLGGGIVSVSAN